MAPETQTQTAKSVFREMKSRASSYGKNFAVVGAMFSATECLVESVSRPVDKFCHLQIYFNCTKHIQTHLLVSICSIEEKQIFKMEQWQDV